jgi:fatty acid desaturase
VGAVVNHLELLKSLDPETRTALLRKSDRAGLKHLSAHVGWIILMGCYVAVGAPFWGLLLVPLGITIVFLFTLLHETVHFTPFARRWLNLLVGHICSVLVIVPNQWFRYFHLAHHKHTNEPAHDPELESPKPTTKWDYVWQISGLPYWRSMARVIWAQAKGDAAAPYLPARAVSVCVWQARAMLVLYGGVVVAVALGHTWLFWCWALPLVLGQPFLRLYLLAEHGHCPPVANMFENTRTTITNRLIRFLAWNMPYHAEHHANPAVPFHQLPSFHQYTKDHLVTKSDGYTRFQRQYIKAL